MSETQKKVDAIFAAAVQRTDRPSRCAYLDQACGDDRALRRRVERLLRAHDNAGSFLGGAPAGSAETVDRPDLREGPGIAVGPYKLLQEIGEGGFGVVYMAEQFKPVRRKVALKIIKPGMDTRQVIARFEAERQALAMMDHPNIARVLDAGATETGRPYFVMELVKGVPITDYCDKNKLSTRDRLELFITVCRAVQHAHQKGVIHRDIKPANIMITLHDGKPVPKVIDFGVSKALNQQLTEKTLFTAYGQMIGTPQYMSPEQAEMSGLDIDTRSDIFSLGVLLYELLTGCTPLDAEQLREAGFAEMQRMICETEPLKPSTRLSNLGEALSEVAKHRDSDEKKLGQLVRGELDWIVMKALDKDRDRRYETANGLAMDVERYLNGEAVLACPPSFAYRFRKFARRNQLSLAGASAVTALLIFATTISTLEAKKWRSEWEKLNKTALALEGQFDGVDDRGSFGWGMLWFVNEHLYGPSGSFSFPDRIIDADFEPGDPHLELRTVLDQAAKRIREIGQPGTSGTRVSATIRGETVNGTGDEHMLYASEDLIRYALGMGYRSLGLWAEAEEHLRRCYELRIQHPEHGEDATETMRALIALSDVLRNAGKYAEAETILSDELGGFQGDPFLGSPRRHQAWVLIRQGRFTEAEKLCREGISGRPDATAWGLGKWANALGIALAGQGRLAEAQEHAEQALNALRGHFNFREEQLEHLVLMSNLSIVYVQQGRYSEAETLRRKVVKSAEDTLPEDHNRFLYFLTALAEVNALQQKDVEAKALYERVWNARGSEYGEDHPEALKTWEGLARIHSTHGRHDDAEELLAKWHDASMSVYGSEHHDTLCAQHRLAWTIARKGRYRDAERLLRPALDARKRTLGDEHPDTLETQQALAECLMSQNKHTEAEQLLLECLDTREKQTPEHHLRFACMALLGECLAKQQRFDDAEGLLKQGYEGLKDREARLQWSETQYLADVVRNLIATCEALQRPDEAARWRAELETAQH